MTSFATWSLLEHDRHFLAGFLSAAAESQTERFTISLRLCALARVNKKYFARKDAKPQRVRRGGR
jgi:hypothetical protein